MLIPTISNFRKTPLGGWIPRIPIWAWPMVFAALLLFYAATRFPLWGDEAETALFAQNILRTGVPSAWDGTNLIAVRDGLALGNNLQAAMVPWPQLYVVAASFAVFGVSAFTARLPFILCSLLLFVLLPKLGKQFQLPDRIVCLMLWITATNIPLLLYLYQARYYPMTICMGILLFLFRSPKTTGQLLIKAGLILLSLLVHYVSAVLFLSVLWLIGTMQILYGTSSAQKGKHLIIHAIPFCAGFFLWLCTWFFVNPLSGHAALSFQWDHFLKNIPTFVSQYGDTGLLPLFLLPWLAYILISPSSSYKNQLKLPLAVLSIYTVLLLLISSIFTSHLNLLDIRYHVILFPFLIAAFAIMLDALFSRWRKLGFLIIVMALGTTGWSEFPPRFYGWDLFAGTANRYDTPDFVVSDFLNRFGHDDEYVFLDKDDAHDPVMFAMRHRVKLINRMSPDNPKLAGHAYLPSYLTSYLDKPDWIIRYGSGPEAKAFNRNTYPLGLSPDIDTATDYDVYVLPIFSRHTSRPEITAHMFYRVSPLPEDYILVYHKKKAGY